MPTINIPPPVGGLNARDAISAMPPSDAIRLFDWVPRGSYVETATPMEEYYAPDGARVWSLIPFESSTTNKLLEVRETSFMSNSWDINDITDTGSVSTLKAAQSYGVYVWTMFNSLLVMCNGEDTPQVYNGTTCTDLVATGPTLTTLRGVITYKGRCYYWQKESQSFWYAAAGSFQGTLAEFPISTFSKRGGKITLLCTITRDGGEGADDLFVVVLSTGEILLYQGDDPASAFSWELIGVFDCPQPIGTRSAYRFGRTTLLATVDGWLDLASVLSGEPYPTFSDKVSNLTKGDLNTNPPQLELLAAVDFPETRSTLFLHNYVYQFSGEGYPFAMAREKTTGGWYHYYSGGDIVEPVCGCVFQGRTYLSGGITDPSTSGKVFTTQGESSSTDPVTSMVWKNVSAYGFALAPTYNGIVYANYSPISPYPTLGDPSDPRAICAYQSPWDALSGQATAIQVITQEDPNVWGSASRYRWLRTSLRVKSGGRR